MYQGDGKEIARLAKLLNLEVGSFRIQFDADPLNIIFTLRECFGQRGNYMDIAGFELIQQINCCGILISTQTWVDKKYRRMGYAQVMMPIKEAFAKELGFSLIMATVNITGNPAEVHILEKFGWKLKDSFVNKRTNNTVGIYTKEIK